MAKAQKKKQIVHTGGGGRAANKPPGKHKKPNRLGANGKTVGGYTPAKLEERALKRKYAHLDK